VEPRACAQYRARTKGKGEFGVKCVTRNALAGRSFGSFQELEAHLCDWMHVAERIACTARTFAQPKVRFERHEAAALHPLPVRPVPTRTQRIV
jgi:transposase